MAEEVKVQATCRGLGKRSLRGRRGDPIGVESDGMILTRG